MKAGVNEYESGRDGLTLSTADDFDAIISPVRFVGKLCCIETIASAAFDSQKRFRFLRGI